MDPDKLEFRQGVVILAGGCAAFAGTFLSPWSVAAAWSTMGICAAATLLMLRRADLADSSMALKTRIAYACAFGFVAARQAIPASDWEWWMPFCFPAAVFAIATPCFPSKVQRGRMARAFPVGDVEATTAPPVGRGWWFGYYLFLGLEVSLLLVAYRSWGAIGAMALFLALYAPMAPLRKLAKRREAQTAKPWRADPAAGPLFPV